MAGKTLLNQHRKGAIAPAAVFEACDALASDAGSDFKIADVAAKLSETHQSTPSNSTLGPIVSLWREHEPLLQSIKTLEGLTAVGLVQEVDKLLSRRLDTRRSESAQITEVAAQQIAELSEKLDQVEHQCGERDSQIEALQGRLDAQGRDYRAIEQKLGDVTHTLSQRDSRIEDLNDKLAAAHRDHSSEIASTVKECQSEKEAALRELRQRLEDDHRAHTETLEADLREASRHAEHAHAELARHLEKSEQREDSLRHEVDSARATIDALERRRETHQKDIEQLEAGRDDLTEANSRQAQEIESARETITELKAEIASLTATAKISGDLSGDVESIQNMLSTLTKQSRKKEQPNNRR